MAIGFGEGDEGLAIVNRSVRAAAEAIHDPAAGIAMIEIVATGREGRAVGHAIAIVHHRDRTIGIEAIERADILPFGHVHRAAPDAAILVRLAIVHAIAGQMRFGIMDRGDRQRVQREAGKTALETADEAALRPLGHPAKRFGHGPARHLAIVERQPVERRGQDIDPIDRIFTGGPERPLPQRVADVAAFDLAPGGHVSASPTGDRPSGDDRACPDRPAPKRSSAGWASRGISAVPARCRRPCDTHGCSCR